MAKAKTATQNTEVALFGDKSDIVPAHLQTDAPVGNENVTTNDMAIPRLTLLQAISPEVREIPEAQAGMLHNSVTKDLYESVNLINLLFQKEYTIFKKRELGGGLEDNFTSQSLAQAHLDTLSSPEDFDIVETDKHFCLLLDAEGKPVSPVILYMSASKLRVSKDWNTEIQLKGKNADRFASAWNLSSRSETNRQNQIYENMQISFMGWVDEELYAFAKDTYKSLSQETDPVAQAA